MKRCLNYALLILIFTGLIAARTSLSQTLPEYFQTGVKLYKNGYYQEARTLLLTIMYTNNLTYPLKLYAGYLVALTYAKESNIPKSIAELKNIRRKIKKDNDANAKYDLLCESLLCEVSYQIAKLYFIERKIDLFLEAKEYFEANCIFTNSKMSDELNLLEIASLIYEMDWNKALDKINSYPLDNNRLKSYLISRLAEITHHKNKSPILGGLLSIIPGLGHIYAGRYSDGIRSFLFNTAFTGLTLYSAIHKEYIFSSIFGLIEFTLYASNIYGGINAVLQKNSLYYVNKRDELLKRIQVEPIEIISIKKEIGL